MRWQRSTVASPLYSTIHHNLSDEVPEHLAEETQLEHVTTPLVEDDTADWLQKLRIGETFAAERNAICTLLDELETMWDGRFGEIDETEHRIELIPDGNPVHQIPYRAGSATRVVIRREIANMREARVV